MVVPSLPSPPRRLHVSLSLCRTCKGRAMAGSFHLFSPSLSPLSPHPLRVLARARVLPTFTASAPPRWGGGGGRRRAGTWSRSFAPQPPPRLRRRRDGGAAASMEARRRRRDGGAAASMAARRRLRPAASLSPRISPAAAAAAADMLQLYLPSPLHRRRPASSPPRPPLHLPPPAHPFLPAPSLLPLPLRFG